MAFTSLVLPQAKDGSLTEMDPLCVLDFYVHESCQRMGLGQVSNRHRHRYRHRHRQLAAPHSTSSHLVPPRPASYYRNPTLTLALTLALALADVRR